MRITEKHYSIKLKQEAEIRDEELFRWLLTTYTLSGRLPSLQEVANTFRFSKERARQRLERLVERGYLIKNAKQGWRKTFIINPDYLLK